MNEAEESAAGVPGSFAQLAAQVEHALALCRSGDARAALVTAEMASLALSQVEVPPTAAGGTTLNQLGMVFFETGYHGRAAPLYERALALAECLTPHEELLENVLNNLGQAQQRMGDLDRARALLERAVASRATRIPDSPGLAVALDNLGSVCTALGQLTRGLELHEQALSILERGYGPFHKDVAVALGNLSLLFLERRELERAQAYRLRAFDISLRRLGILDHGTLIELQGVVHTAFECGDQERADRFLSLLLSLGGSEPKPEHRVLAGVCLGLARSALSEFRLDIAERVGTRAVELLDVLEGPENRETLQAVQLLANVHRATNDLDHAEAKYLRALRGFTALERRDDALTITIDLAKLYRDRGAYPLAIELLRNAALELEAATPQQHQDLLASALGNLAETYYHSGEYELARATYERALQQARAGAAQRELPWLLHGLGILHYHLGNHGQARPLLEEAQQRWTDSEGNEHSFVATTAMNLALVHWAEGDLERACEMFTFALARKERAMRRILAVGTEQKRTAYARGVLDDLHMIMSFMLATPKSVAAAELAAETALQFKGRVLDAMSHSFARVRQQMNIEEETLLHRLQRVRTDLAEQVAPIPAAPGEHRDIARIAQLRAEEEELEAALSYHGALKDPDLDPVSVASLQAGLPIEAALLEFVEFRRFEPLRSGQRNTWGDPRYAVVVLQRDRSARWFDLGATALLDARVDELRRLLRRRSSAAADVDQKAAEVAEFLFTPFENELRDVRRLLIAPDGKLALLPFGMLRDGSGQRLSARFTISYLSTGRMLQSSETPSANREVLVVAAPDFDSSVTTSAPGAADALDEDQRFAPLPDTKGEADDLEALLRRVTILEGAAATSDAVKNADAPAILHVATHGFFANTPEPETEPSLEFLPTVDGTMIVQGTKARAGVNPMFYAGLALAGANRRSINGRRGVLTAQEMAGMNLRGTELVVLSACETGLGTAGGGQEFTGLRRALAMAGAAAQLTSLWRVDDLATRVLMRSFYGALLAGRGRAEALQLAQEQVQQDAEHPEWAHPFYWGAFVLSGAWTPISAELIAHLTAPAGQGPRKESEP